MTRTLQSVRGAVGVVAVGVLAVVVLTLLVSACASRQQTGAVVGAGAGAATGAAISDGHPVITLLGAVLGAAVGSEVGRAMDGYDRQRIAFALEGNRTHQPTVWENPDTGYQYRVTPTRTYYDQRRPCREFAMHAQIDGRWERVYGVACRRGDGRWEMVS